MDTATLRVVATRRTTWRYETVEIVDKIVRVRSKCGQIPRYIGRCLEKAGVVVATDTRRYIDECIPLFECEHPYRMEECLGRITIESIDHRYVGFSPQNNSP